MSTVRILYLEDNPDDAALAQYTAAHHGQACEWIITTNAAEFRAALERGGFDLILLDSQVPGLDGLSAFRASQAAWPKLPVVILSGGRLAPRSAVANILAGAADQIDKADLWRLVPILHRVRERRELEMRVREVEAQLEAANQELAARADTVPQELREALRAIADSSELLSGAAGSSMDEIAQESVRQIRSAARRATGLVDDLLTRGVFGDGHGVSDGAVDHSRAAQPDQD